MHSTQILATFPVVNHANGCVIRTSVAQTFHFENDRSEHWVSGMDYNNILGTFEEKYEQFDTAREAIRAAAHMSGWYDL